MKILILPPQDGPQVVLRVLKTRWITIVSTIVASLTLVTGWLLVTGHTYTATTGVEIVAVNSDPSAVLNGNSASVIASEVGLVRSGETASKAATQLGDGITAAEILEGIAVSAKTEGKVISISWTDKDPDRAQRISSAVAEAYLVVRGELVLKRAEAITQIIDQQILAQERELAALTGDSADTAARRETLRSAMQALTSRKAELIGLEAPAGRIITSNDVSGLVRGPSRVAYLAAAAGGGLFLGLALALVREKLDQRVRGPKHLAEIINAPVWCADLSERGEMRWFGAARMATLIGKDQGSTALIVSSSDAEAPLLVAAFTDAQSDLSVNRHLQILDLDGPRADLLRALAGIDLVAIAPGPGIPKEDVAQLVDQIDLSGCQLTGAFYIPHDALPAASPQPEPEPAPSPTAPMPPTFSQTLLEETRPQPAIRWFDDAGAAPR